jgi:hypothetical protein
VLPSGASAAKPQPVGDCPTSFYQSSSDGLTGGLWSVKEANRRIAAEGFDLGSSDTNADGYICIMFTENFPPELFDPGFVFTDNNVQGG